MARERFYFYERWWRVLCQLPTESASTALMAACSLVFDEEDHSSELDPEARVAFMFIKQDIERDQEAYNLVIERNRRNGQNGGRPRNPQDNQENPENPSEPNKNRVEESRGDKSREDKKGINNSLSLSREEEERERERFF